MQNMEQDTALEVRRAKNNKNGGHKVGAKGRVGYCRRCQGKCKSGGNDHDSSLPEGQYSTRCSVPASARVLIVTEYDQQRQTTKIQTEKIQRGVAIGGLNKGKQGSRPPKKKTVEAKKKS